MNSDLERLGAAMSMDPRDPNITQAVCDRLCKRAAQLVVMRVEDEIALNGLSIDTFSSEDVVASGNDTVSVSLAGTDRALVKLDQHQEASFTIPDIIAALENSAIADRYMSAATVALADSFTSLITKDKNMLVAMRSPNCVFLPGTGVVSSKFIVQNFIVCLIMGYDQASLQQTFRIHMLFGVAERP